MDIKEVASIIGVVGALFGAVRWSYLYIDKKFLEPIKKNTERVKDLDDDGEKIQHNSSRINYVDKKLDCIIYLFPLPMFVTDSNGLCTLANEEICDLFGSNENEMKGFGWLNFIHPDDRQKALAAWESVVKNYGMDVKLSYRVVHGDTSEIIFCTYHALISRDGDFKVIVSVGKVIESK